MSLSALLQATTVFGIIPIVDFVSQTDREDLSAVSRVIFDFITSSLNPLFRPYKRIDLKLENLVF